MKTPPFFSIVTVARNDSWSLVKTMRSVFEQDFDNFEYIAIDGASEDGTRELLAFWQRSGLVSKAVSEPDTSVYNAMNKGLRMASGKYVCFLNASDVFADAHVLDRVHTALSDKALDGLLGWGELNDQIWASWTENEAFKMASLGFCHQSLFVRRDLLLEEPFDERPFKTDSDTLQLGRLYARGARIAILPEVLAVRGGEPGISADMERSARSIRATLVEEYPGLTEADAEAILAFRRKCTDPGAIIRLMGQSSHPFNAHLARMVLDTLFQRQSAALESGTFDQLLDTMLEVLHEDADGALDAERLLLTQQRRAQLLEEKKAAQRTLDKEISTFAASEEKRLDVIRAARPAVEPTQPASDLVVSLTSFPARLKTVSFVITSLLEQTCPPGEIHLWLGRDEVPNKNWLPKRLQALEERGVQFHFARRTFHQYDKFLHNSELNTDRPFVIVDDDAIYPPTSLENLIAAHQRYPDAVIGNRCHLINVDQHGCIAPYRDWKREVHMPRPGFRLMPTGVGGVLYPPGFLADPMVTSVEDIFENAPYADDVWLKTCALARSVPTFATPLSHRSDWYHRYTPTMRAGTLMNTNVERGLNDIQITRCSEFLDRVRPDWRAQLVSEVVGA